MLNKCPDQREKPQEPSNPRVRMPSTIHTAKPMAENFTASDFTCGYLSTLHTQAKMMPGMPTKAPMTNHANFMPPVSFVSGAG